MGSIGHSLTVGLEEALAYTTQRDLDGAGCHGEAACGLGHLQSTSEQDDIEWECGQGKDWWVKWQWCYLPPTLCPSAPAELEGLDLKSPSGKCRAALLMTQVVVLASPGWEDTSTTCSQTVLLETG